MSRLPPSHSSLSPTRSSSIGSSLKHIDSSFGSLFFGGSSGIGAETARVLAFRGAHVIIGARNLEAADNVKQKILQGQISPARVDIIQIDVSSLRSVRAFADKFLAMDLPLNVLINNAGIMYCPFQLSKDGVEMQFATNHLGHFLLTNLLLEKMKTTTAKRSASPSPPRLNLPTFVAGPPRSELESVQLVLKLSQHDALEAKFFEERTALEDKYQKLYEALYTKRYEIVNGIAEVEGITEESATNSSEEKGVQGFWLNAMNQNKLLVDEIAVWRSGG